MVPIYAVDSFVSLRFRDAAPYVDMLRDCYEGYALYLFLALMVGYLGDGDEYKVCGERFWHIFFVPGEEGESCPR